MFKNIGYDRQAAVDYAKKWSLSRNPKYYSFNALGGDCTSFVSQCLYAGCGVMNFTPIMGWYYISLADRTASWSGVMYLYNFLINNAANPEGAGPYAIETDASGMQIGDVIQLGRNNGQFYHSLLVTSVANSKILVSAHSDDANLKPLSQYNYQKIRYLHIEGCRKMV